MIRRSSVSGLVVALAALVVWQSSRNLAGARQLPGSLAVQLALGKRDYVFMEEMPVVISVTNTSRNAGLVRFPEALRSLDLQVSDARTTRPIEPRISYTKAESGWGLQFRPPGSAAAPAAPKEPDTGASSPPESSVGHKGPDGASPGTLRRNAFSRATRESPLTTLDAGATAVTDLDVLVVYGQIPVSNYVLRAVYATDGATHVSPRVAIGVTPVPPGERSAYKEYSQGLWGQTREETLANQESFLRRFPNSIFGARVQRDALWSARLLRKWNKVVELGMPLYVRPLWHGEQEVTGINLAAGLWHTSLAAEAEQLLLSINQGEALALVHRLRQGEE